VHNFSPHDSGSFSIAAGTGLSGRARRLGQARCLFAGLFESRTQLGIEVRIQRIRAAAHPLERRKSSLRRFLGTFSLLGGEQ
jgi:hypothetical protein